MKNRNLNHSDNWKTPPDFYEKLDKEFGFDFDPCPWNHDINKWDGLVVEWGYQNFVNPPYSRKLKEAFIIQAANCALNSDKKSVLLLPVSTSTMIFHQVIKTFSKEIRFVEGRLRFIGINDKGQYINYDQIQEVTNETIEYDGIEIPKYIKNNGQHDSMIVIF